MVTLSSPVMDQLHHSSKFGDLIDLPRIESSKLILKKSKKKGENMNIK